MFTEAQSVKISLLVVVSLEISQRKFGKLPPVLQHNQLQWILQRDLFFETEIGEKKNPSIKGKCLLVYQRLQN